MARLLAGNVINLGTYDTSLPESRINLPAAAISECPRHFERLSPHYLLREQIFERSISATLAIESSDAIHQPCALVCTDPFVVTLRNVFVERYKYEKLLKVDSNV